MVRKEPTVLELWLQSNVPSNLLKFVCAKHFLCAKFYQHSSILRTTCMKYMPETLFNGKCMCAHLMTCVCTHTHSLERTLLESEEEEELTHRHQNKAA